MSTDLDLSRNMSMKSEMASRAASPSKSSTSSSSSTQSQSSSSSSILSINIIRPLNLILLGTSHIDTTPQDIKSALDTLQPMHVALELDQKRFDSIFAGSFAGQLLVKDWDAQLEKRIESQLKQGRDQAWAWFWAMNRHKRCVHWLDNDLDQTLGRLGGMVSQEALVGEWLRGFPFGFQFSLTWTYCVFWMKRWFVREMTQMPQWVKQRQQSHQDSLCFQKRLHVPLEKVIPKCWKGVIDVESLLQEMDNDEETALKSRKNLDELPQQWQIEIEKLWTKFENLLYNQVDDYSLPEINDVVQKVVIDERDQMFARKLLCGFDRTPADHAMEPFDQAKINEAMDRAVREMGGVEIEFDVEPENDIGIGVDKINNIADSKVELEVDNHNHNDDDIDIGIGINKKQKKNDIGTVLGTELDKQRKSEGDALTDTATDTRKELTVAVLGQLHVPGVLGQLQKLQLQTSQSIFEQFQQNQQINLNNKSHSKSSNSQQMQNLNPNLINLSCQSQSKTEQTQKLPFLMGNDSQFGRTRNLNNRKPLLRRFLEYGLIRRLKCVI